MPGVATNFDLRNESDSRRFARLLAEYGPLPNPVVFRSDRAASKELVESRKGYTEAYMMQSCGNVNPRECIQCGGAQGPFLTCHSVPGELNGACASCHWSQRANACTLNAKLHDDSKPPVKKKKPRSDKGTPKKAKASAPAAAASKAATATA